MLSMVRLVSRGVVEFDDGLRGMCLRLMTSSLEKSVMLFMRESYMALWRAIGFYTRSASSDLGSLLHAKRWVEPAEEMDPSIAL